MYITYESEQYIWNEKEKRSYRRHQPITKVPNELPKPDFMPTKLVRISDMTTVDGSQVNEGYCALSYSWNQSGEIYYDEAREKHKRIDEGRHKIISYDNMFPDMIIPYSKIFINDKLKKIYQILQIMAAKNYYFTRTIKYVKFEGIIQHICQQFNIKYIWYDQMCINQDDREEKYREIRKMHNIYSNAHWTVALVPDYTNGRFTIGDNGEEYFKRLWTLEEAIKSEKVLFVGKNRHIHGDRKIISNSVNILTKQSSKLQVSQILHHAHQRTSTKEHDRVFALINLFPDFIEQHNYPLKKLKNRLYRLFSTKNIIDKIIIDYDQPFEDLMIQFYGLLAKKDISILLFRNNRQYNSKIQKYEFLPSWTGVNGEHLPFDATTSFKNYDIIKKTMRVTSEFVTNDKSIDDNSLAIRKEDLPLFPDNTIDGRDHHYYRLCILVQLPGATEIRIRVTNFGYDFILEKEILLDRISEELKRLSRFMEIKKENLYWCHRRRDEYKMVADIKLEFLTEDVNNFSAQYMILSEVCFKGHQDSIFYYPVLKKQKGKLCKAIGFCRAHNNGDVFSECVFPKQTLLIQ